LLPVAAASALLLGRGNGSSESYPPVRGGGCTPFVPHAWVTIVAGGAGGGPADAGPVDAGGAGLDCFALCKPGEHCADCAKPAVGGYEYACRELGPADGGTSFACLAEYHCPDAGR
jgi:hypothetical protein